MPNGPHSRWTIQLSIDITRRVPRAAPPHGIEGYGFIRLLVDRVNGCGPMRSCSRMCIDFKRKLRLGRDGGLGSGCLGSLLLLGDPDFLFVYRGLGLALLEEQAVLGVWVLSLAS